MLVKSPAPAPPYGTQSSPACRRQPDQPPQVTLRRSLSPSGAWSVLTNDRLTGGLASLLVHSLIFIALALWIHATPEPQPYRTVLTVALADDSVLEDDAVDQHPAGALGDAQPDFEIGAVVTVQEPVALTVSWNDPAALASNDAAVFEAALPRANWMEETGAATGGGLQGRTAGLKGRLLQQRGGNGASEDAVARGLRWLAAHQRKNGSWWFNHQDGPCQGHCRHPGDFAPATASTALALLPFYGAGFTHLDGQYQEVIDRALYYLQSQMIATPHGGDLQQGSMYAQGLAAIVLCEAYAMTADENLRDFAQASVRFIEYAQHPEGGWRYLPGQPGDMTVTGWQLMALKSAKMSRLDVSQRTFYRVTHFLDAVQSADAASYGYQNDEPRPTTTAIGLYCRMLTGWPRTNPALMQGVAYLDKTGPSPNDIYFNYYATQVMNHYDGPRWQTWNVKMRDQLIRDQATQGHEAGSWFYAHPHSEAGGRLYNTCLAIMTLEVYYRYMPLYEPTALDGF